MWMMRTARTVSEFFRAHCEMWTCDLWGWRGFQEKMQRLRLSVISRKLKCISSLVSQSRRAEFVKKEKVTGWDVLPVLFLSPQPDDMQEMFPSAEIKTRLIWNELFKPIWITCRWSWPFAKRCSVNFKKRRELLWIIGVDSSSFLNTYF